MPSLSLTSLYEIEASAALFLELNAGQQIFAFRGEMGSGKTTFITALCKTLGVDNNVSSPTFSIVNEYTSNKGKTIYHFDLYRIKNIGELFDIGFEEYISDDTYVFIEWPEKAYEILPPETIIIDIKVLNNGTRILIW